MNFWIGSKSNPSRNMIRTRFFSLWIGSRRDLTRKFDPNQIFLYRSDPQKTWSDPIVENIILTIITKLSRIYYIDNFTHILKKKCEHSATFTSASMHDNVSKVRRSIRPLFTPSPFSSSKWSVNNTRFAHQMIECIPFTEQIRHSFFPWKITCSSYFLKANRAIQFHTFDLFMKNCIGYISGLFMSYFQVL